MTPSKKPDPSLASIAELSYEKALAQLEEIVAALEGEEHSLDAALVLFERGQELIRRCTELLDQAELRIKVIQGEELVNFEHREE